MPPSNTKPRIVEKGSRWWKNKHENVQLRIDKLYDFWNAASGNTIDLLKSSATGMAGLIKSAKKDGARLRAYGGTWSLSRMLVTDGRLINTKPLNIISSINASSTSASYKGNREDLFFVQCGASVQEVNNFLKARNRSLKTTGASNGQTMAGAIATGTHGSAFDVGAMQDYVVAMHLVTGTNRQILLERASYPVHTPGFAAKLGAELMRNDDIFNAALIHFGGMGLVHGLTIETEPLFLLDLNRKLMPLDDKLIHAMSTMDFSNINLPGPSSRPYHFEVVFNLYDIPGGVYVTTMHKRPYTPNYAPPELRLGGLGPGDDLLSVVGTLSDAVPALVPTMVKGLVGSFYASEEQETGTIGEIFSATTVRGKGLSTEMGIPIASVPDAIQKIQDALDVVKTYAGIVAFRFVKGSKATLAFTKYDTTCTIEMQGVYSQTTRDFYNQVWKEFDNAGIPFTFHWGQVSNLSASSMRAKWGDAAVNSWLAARKTLTPDAAVREVFMNPTMERLNLDDEHTVTIV